ncbi:hypothetical protein ACIBL6_18850 [Streptomyces sp. NPDC050400]|uniref:hypothetical protein n=1 Tax=Streptomyces sp. NPDC050400 TaxID=3365610 RepID=UPI00379A4C75
MSWWTRKPEERAQWVFEPLVGVGPLRFGMNSDQVAAALDGAVAYVSSGLGEPLGWGEYGDWGVTAFYGEDAGLVAVEVEAMGGPLVRLRDVQLIAQPPSVVRAQLHEHARQENVSVHTNWSGDPEIAAWGLSMGTAQALAQPVDGYLQRLDQAITGALFAAAELAEDPYGSGPVKQRFDVSDMATNPGAWPAKPGQDRPHWDWPPLQKIGPLRFGMSPDEVAAALGEEPTNRFGRYPFGQSWEGIGTWMLHDDRFDNTGVTAHYSSGFSFPPVLGAVTVHGRTGPQVDYAGIQLIGRPVSIVDEALIQHVDSHGIQLVFGCGGDLGPDDLNMYVRATRAGDAMISEARFCQEEWEDHG